MSIVLILLGALLGLSSKLSNWLDLPGRIIRNKMNNVCNHQSVLYEKGLQELKQGHGNLMWVWDLFPQIRLLGHTPGQLHYQGLDTLEEVKAYWEHPVLKSRLQECFSILLAFPEKNVIEDIVGVTQGHQIHATVSMFKAVAPQDPLLTKVLARFFENKLDKHTLRQLDLPAI